MVALAGGCTNPAELGGNFQITHHNNHVVFGTFTRLGETEAWGPSELGNVPTDLKAQRVRYLNAASDRTEAHVFLADPQNIYNALLDTPPYPIGTFSDFGGEAQLAPGVGVTYPRQGISITPVGGPPRFGVPFNDVDLTASMFPAPRPTCYSTTGGQIAPAPCPLTIQAARVYDRGACSTDVDSEDIGTEIADDVACQYQADATTDVVPISIFGLHLFDTTLFGNNVAVGKTVGIEAASVLTHAPGQLSDAHGGIALDSAFVEEWHNPNTDELSGATFDSRIDEYLFQLDDSGFLTLKHDQEAPYTGGIATQYDPGKVVNGIEKAMSSTILTQFAAGAKLEQEVKIPKSLTDTTSYQTCSTVSDCFKCASPEGDPKSCANPPNVIKTGLRVAQSYHLITSAERNALIGIIADHNNWDCAADAPPGPQPRLFTGGAQSFDACYVPDEPPSPKVCRLILPAERLNVYPDRVELVWYEHNERPMTAPFALSMALAAGGRLTGKPLQQMLCSGDAPNWSTNPNDCNGQSGGCFDSNWYPEQSWVTGWRPYSY